MGTLKDKARYISLFLVGRFPFVNALTLLMLLGERASRETYPPFDPRIIYSHLVVMALVGACMSFSMFRQQAAVVHSGQLLYLAFATYTSERLKYNEWTKMRMVHRYIGAAGIFLLYAFFNAPKPRNQQLRRMAEILLGIYTVCAVYTLVESPEDKEGFLRLVPGGMVVFYIYALLYCVAALCYLPGYFVYDAMQVFVILLAISTVFVDCNFQYWTRKRGMDYWNQIRLISDNCCIIVGFVMYLTCTKKTIHSDKED